MRDVPGALSAHPASMLSPTPAVRAAIFGLLVVTVIAVAGAMLHLSSVASLTTRALVDQLGARAHTVSRGLGGDGVQASLNRFADPDADALMVYGPSGRLVATTDAALAEAADWGATVASLEGLDPVADVAGVAYGLAAADLAGGGRLVVVAPVPDALPDGTVLQSVLATASLWGFLVGVFVVMTWYTGPRTAHQLALLGERVAQGDADGDALLRHAGVWLGPLAEAFRPVTTRFQQLGREARDSKEHIASLYQINPHYVILCTLDGEIVDANPAFYAATGLPVAAVREGRVEALNETFPVLPLMELAQRSLKEGSAITGIEYALISRDDETRPVEVSLRGFELNGRPMALFQATDQAHEKQLERRVSAFTDTLDLMVDQRVHQLSAGQQTLKRILDASGVVIASFDAGGATSRWSGAAEGLTGRAIASVSHFAAATDVLGLSPTERTAFTQWFWSPSQSPFFGRHGVVGRDGQTRTRQFIWQRVDADMGGRSDLRTLIGVEIPAYVDLSGASGDSLPRGARLGV